MIIPKHETSVFRIRFFVDLPSHSADLNYSIHSDQAITGSIICSHYPLDDAELNDLQSAYDIVTLSKVGGVV